MSCRYDESKKLLSKSKYKERTSNQQERLLGRSQSVPYFNLYKHSTKRDKVYIGFGLTLSMVTVVAVTILAFMFGKITNAIVNYVATVTYKKESNQVEIAKENFLHELLSFSLITCVLGVLSMICTYSSTVLFSYASLNQSYKIKELFLSKILNQDISWYDLNETGDFSSRMADDLRKIEEGIGEKVPIVFMYIGVFLTSITQAIVTGWQLALVCLLSVPINVIAIAVISWISTTYTKFEVNAYGTAGSIAEEVFTAIKTVIAFGGEEKEAERYNKYLEIACYNNIKRSLFNGICNGIMWLSTYGFYALGFWYGVELVLEHREVEDGYEISSIVTIFFSIVTGSWFLMMALPYVETFGMAQGAAGKIFEIISNEPVLNVSKGNGIQLRKIRGRITFRNVYFSYPSRPNINVLQGFNLTINAGETVAIVGSSGCGKSTCIQLLQRFYDPNFGSILVDNYNLIELDLTWFRSHIGVVEQEPVLFETTVLENIKLGSTDASEYDVEEAAKLADAHKFILQLPQQYHTLVGERGIQLSGGQKQRIAIARALVRKPAILLLDEATSALDISCETAVQQALDTVRSQCTTLIVAHKLSTIKRADKIVVVSKGRVQEEGTHEDLMNKMGSYFSLVMAQVPQENVIEEIPVPIILEKLDSVRYGSLDNVKRRQSSYFYDVIEEVSTEMSVGPIMKYNAPEWWAIVLGCIASVINGAGLPLCAILFGQVMQTLVDDDADYIRNQTEIFAVCFLAIAIIIGLTSLFQTYLFGIAGEKLTMRLRSKMFQSFLYQDLGYFDNKANSVGALCARLSTEPASVQMATGQRIGIIITSFSTAIFALIISFLFEWRVTLVSLCIAPILGFTFYLEPRLINQEDNVYYKTLQSSTKVAVEGINSIRTVASLGCEKIFFELYMKQMDLYQKKSKRNAHIRGIIYGLSRGLIFFAYFAVLFYGSVVIIEDHVDFFKVFIVAEAIITSSWSIATALAFTPNFRKGLLAANRIVQVLNRVPLVCSGSGNVNQRWDRSNVDYKNISFSYPTRPKTLVLKNFDLSIFEGRTVALVGPSGCGKSTIVQLLARFYDPTSGSVLVDNESIRTMHLSALRAQLGVVSQEPCLFNVTVADNIAYGDNNRVVSRTEIIEAAKKANIHDFINSLPQGYDTKLGEKGTQLSGGQKQRIAIARALIRNPKILILDEATSALDSESERIVQEALENAKKGRTCIIIGHRLNTVQDADVIAVISQGKVAELGTHSELLNLKGLYYSFYYLHSL